MEAFDPDAEASFSVADRRGNHFKKLNYRYGHPEGDAVSGKKIAEQLSKLLRRSSDTLARYGGEEFVAILPETTRESAQLIAELDAHVSRGPEDQE